MRIIHQRANAQPKLCNLQPGDAVMVVDGATGAESGPFILMSPEPYKPIQPSPQPAPAPAPAPMPGAPPGWHNWKEGSDVRLLEPCGGTVHTIHASTRGRLLKNAAFILNENEEA